MTSVRGISRTLLQKCHGKVSLKSIMAGFCTANIQKYLQSIISRNTYTIRPLEKTFNMSFKELHTINVNCAVARLSFRLCSGKGLAAKHHIGIDYSKLANEGAVSLSSSSLRVHLHKKWICSGKGLVLRHCYQFDCRKLFNDNVHVVSQSSPSLRVNIYEKRIRSGRGLAIRRSYATVSSDSTNEDALSLSHPSLRAYLPKRRLCSGLLLAIKRNYSTDSSEPTNEDALSLSNPSLRAYLQHLANEHQQIYGQLADEQNAADGKKQKRLRQRLAELTPLVEKMDEWKEKQTELTEIEELISDPSAAVQDEEMKEMAMQEKQECLEDVDTLETEILKLLTPVDKTDDNDIIIEFSAGVGGQEAMLFTADMFEMYERFAAYKNWDFQKLEYFTTDLGGLRHAMVSVSGDGAYKLMKHEAGVHRVQRVPKTEKAGRIHTSTMAVAVLPQPKEIDLKLDPKDLRIETKKASGAGGQHVNTTDSAVRIMHLPTGIVAESQQQRSQLKNRTIAMVMLQTKIYNSILEKQEMAERSMRRSQVGSSGRSEKIRTYNFQQDRVTDHRIAQSTFDVEGFLSGGDRLDEMISSLAKEEEDEAVSMMIEEFAQSQKINE